jgi:hypothetical protein
MDEYPNLGSARLRVASPFALAVAFSLLIGFSLIIAAVAFHTSGVRALYVGFPGLLLVASGFAGALKLEKLAENRRKNEVMSILGGSSPTTEYFEKLVNINVENLSAYYITVKSHANKSFFASLFVALAGFVLIGVGIELAMTHAKEGISVAQLSGLAGVATEFISAVFFYLYSRTVRQMKEYHNSLLAVQNVLLSFKLVGETTEPTEKVPMIRIMLEYLVGMHPAAQPGSFGRDQSRRKTRDSEAAAPVEAD